METQGEDSHVPRENAKGFCKHRKLEEIRKDPPRTVRGDVVLQTP